MAATGNGTRVVTAENVATHVGYLRDGVDRIERKVDNNLEKVEQMFAKLEKDAVTREEKYVRKEDYSPVKGAVFGLIGLVLLTVFGGLLTLVVKSSS